jgi:hypothetical protein
MKKKTERYLKAKIREDFDSAEPFQFHRLQNCIRVAKDLGFKKLARKMTLELL